MTSDMILRDTRLYLWQGLMGTVLNSWGSEDQQGTQDSFGCSPFQESFSWNPSTPASIPLAKLLGVLLNPHFRFFLGCSFHALPFAEITPSPGQESLLCAPTMLYSTCWSLLESPIGSSESLLSLGAPSKGGLTSLASHCMSSTQHKAQRSEKCKCWSPSRV